MWHGFRLAQNVWVLPLAALCSTTQGSERVRVGNVGGSVVVVDPPPPPQQVVAGGGQGLGRRTVPGHIDADRRICELPRHIHVFGHSHRPKDFCYDGIRYIHNPVGKPVEREMDMISNDFDFQLIWDASSDIWEVSSGETVIRYWEQWGGGVKLLAENMAKRRRSRRNRRAGAGFKT